MAGIALKVHDLDNVATIFAEGISDGQTVEVRDKRGNREMVTVSGMIPSGLPPGISHRESMYMSIIWTV